MNGLTSEYLDINCGMPQGSILGPMLFLLYINDINSTLNLVLCMQRIYMNMYVTTGSART